MSKKNKDPKPSRECCVVDEDGNVSDAEIHLPILAEAEGDYTSALEYGRKLGWSEEKLRRLFTGAFEDK